MTHPPYVLVQKLLGETPLEAIERLRREQPQLASLRASYAGRLDPMATGTLLVLLGDECLKQTDYTGLDKEYDIEVVFGATTDTGDALGLASIAANRSVTSRESTRLALRAEVGTYERAYPLFSSKTVNGKPLFLYALSGTTDTITIPSHTETVHQAELLSLTHLSTAALAARIEDQLRSVPRSNEPSKILGADFRQDEIRERWSTELSALKEPSFTMARIRVLCGSGTYMRSLAKRLGETLGTTGFALTIHRNAIGRYTRETGRLESL